MSLDDVLKLAAPAHKDFSLCVSSPLRQEWDTLVSRLDALEVLITEESENPAGDSRLGVKSQNQKLRTELKTQLEQLKPQIAEASITLRFSAMTFVAWNQLLVEHPPREGNLTDRAFGCNSVTFFAAAMRESGQLLEGETIVPITPEQWDKLAAVFTDAVMDEIVTIIMSLNRREGASVPFSLADFEKTAD